MENICRKARQVHAYLETLSRRNHPDAPTTASLTPSTQKREGCVQRGTISGAPGRSPQPAHRSRAPKEQPHGGHCTFCSICLLPGHGPGPAEIQALLARLTLSILYLWRVVSLNCFPSTRFDETCLGKKSGWSWVSAWVGGTKRAP